MLLLFGLAAGLPVLRGRLPSALGPQPVHFKRWAGIVLAGLGLWFVALSVWAEPFGRLFPV